MAFSIIGTDMEGVRLITSFFEEDNRGSFTKSYEKDAYAKSGIAFSCQEQFITHSIKNVVRGMHFQIHNPQAKLVSIVCGKVFDVIVDLRKGSATFGQWRGFYLSAGNLTSLYIPKGFAHGFLSIENDSIVNYLCEGAYDKETDSGIVFNDPKLDIDWPINNIEDVCISRRDRTLMSFAAFCDSVGGLEG